MIGHNLKEIHEMKMSTTGCADFLNIWDLNEISPKMEIFHENDNIYSHQPLFSRLVLVIL